MENMGAVKTIAFDKTGTLTHGTLQVSDVTPFNEMSAHDLLRVAASAEARSEHPLGKAIVRRSDELGLSRTDVSSFSMSAGRGVMATVDSKEYRLGNEAFMKESGIAVEDKVHSLITDCSSEGKGTVLVSTDGKVIGAISLSDVVRDESKQVVSELKSMGVKTVLLTGDKKETAEHLAARIGIDEVRAELLPEDKVSCVESLRSNGKVCMIGDGVNDAPALKIADVGVAMGAMGSNIAIDAADVALMTDDISKVPYLKWLSNATTSTIKIAITISMCINFVAIIASVMGILNPTTGAIVHNAGSCFVVLLAALLYDRKYPGEKRSKKKEPVQPAVAKN